MSVTAMSRTFWTEFPPLFYVDKGGKQVAIKNSTAKIVLLAIADNADDFGENSYQSFETLAKKSSIDRRSVIRVIRALINNGFLVVAGVSAYGTNNYTIALDKLGELPTKRAKAGRPKSSDSESLVTKTGGVEAETSDLREKTSDPEAETSDPVSPESSSNPPSSIPLTDDELRTLERQNSLRLMYETHIGPITTLAMDALQKAATDYQNPDWYQPAFDVMIANAKHRSWNYVDKVLAGWAGHYFGWRPGSPNNGKPVSVAQSGDHNKYINNPYADYIEH